MKHSISRTAVVALTMWLGFAAGTANATTLTFNFGDLLSGQSGPDDSSTWGTMSVATGTSNTYTFSLGLNSNFSTLFGSGAFVSEAIFNTPSGLDPTSASILGGSWGVSKVKLVTNAPTLSMGFDFGDCFGASTPCNHGSSSGRLQAGESVSWTTTFSTSQGDPLNFAVPPVGLHVQAFNSFNGNTSAWYGVTPVTSVPEPETYAMLLAGLGLIGFTARRRRGG